MNVMLGTLDVSKLSGWLNAVALCRVEREHAKRGEVRAGRRQDGGAVAAQDACRGRTRLEIGRRGGGRAYHEHGVDGYDVGRVKAQRLVERRGTLSSRKGSMRSGARCGLGGGWAVERRRRKMRAGEGPTGDWAQGRRRAHRKHGAHGCDLGRVEAQRLIECRRALPSRKGSMRSLAGCWPGEGRTVERRRRMQCAGECLTGGWAQGRRGAHRKHVGHVCDARRVKTERLVESRRALRCRGSGGEW